ncbi:hypothetical protein EI555_001505, partial [Monodon monoceros]
TPEVTSSLAEMRFAYLCGKMAAASLAVFCRRVSAALKASRSLISPQAPASTRYVLLKERNMLLTLEQEAKRQRLPMPSPERLEK